MQAFNEHVDYSDLGLFSDPFEQFQFSKKKYKGQVSEDGFALKMRRKLFDPRFPFAKATGRFIKRGQLTIIETQIDGRHPAISFVLALSLIIYVVVIADIALRGDWTSLLLPGTLAHAALMFGSFYAIMRWSVKHLKTNLEREIGEWLAG